MPRFEQRELAGTRGAGPRRTGYRELSAEILRLWNLFALANSLCLSGHNEGSRHMAFVWFSWREGFAFHLAEFLGGRERGGERTCFRLYRSLPCVRVILVLFGDLLLSDSGVGTTKADSSCAFENEIGV